jgi:hypothetical protein
MKQLSIELLKSYPIDEDNGILLQICTRTCTEEGKQLGYKIGRMRSCVDYTSSVGVMFEKDDMPVDYFIDEIKPLLRPLSDIDKEIEFDGIKFIPYDTLKSFVSEKQWFKICSSIDLDGGEYSNLGDMPYWWTKTILQWHFDVHGLIKKGLAIDINTNEAARELLAMKKI